MSVVCVADLRRRARRQLPRMIFDFVDGGADDEITLAENLASFDRWFLRPRALVDVSERDLSTRVLGADLAMPLVLAPTGMQKMVHRDGELATARAAGAAGVGHCLSIASNYSLEQVAAASSGPRWFQMHLWRDRDLVYELIDRAEQAGYHALCVTVDVAGIGLRRRDARNGMTVPPRVSLRNALDVAARPRWLHGLLTGGGLPLGNIAHLPQLRGTGVVSHVAFSASLTDPSVTWDDIARVRERWTRPLLIKGVLTADDARRAADLGADAVVVSNHGGRQLDGLPAALDALPTVVAEVGHRVEVLMDGGVRRGTDVLKALALGARACLIGRPYLYGLAAGQPGVTRVLDIFRAELDRALGLLGARSVAELDPSFVARDPAPAQPGVARGNGASRNRPKVRRAP